MKDIRIMLVEDTESDVILFKRSLEELKLLNELDVANNGKEALNKLTDKRNEAPDLIFLDLNMPEMTGLEFLKAVKEIDSIKYIPVVVLTTSDDLEDIKKTYQLYASAYVTKPIDILGLHNTMKAIQGFWFNVVKYSSK